MKASILFIFPILTVFSMPVFSQSQSTYRAMTYNIKYDNPNDTVNAWENRRDVIVGMIKYHKVDIFGIQEGLRHQVKYLEEHLPDFQYIGIARQGGSDGEYCAVFYNSNKFEMLEHKTFWLSEAPNEVTKGWDAAFPRICTWGKFRSKSDNQEFFFFNTHFDHRGKEARRQSALLLAEKIPQISGDLPVILAGDFNFTDKDKPYRIIQQEAKLQDARKMPEILVYGPENTFNGFEFCKPLKRRIDFIFINEAIEVSQYAVLSDSYQMKYPSDHLPVVVTFLL